MSEEFNFLDEYTLENRFVRLSPLKNSHISSLLDVANEEDLWTYMTEKGNGQDNLTRYINSAIHNRNIEKEYPFIVYDKVKNKYAGVTRLYEYSKTLKVIKLGHTWYGKQFRGSGVNKNCKFLLFEFIFEHLKLERIGLGVHSENKVSIAAIESIGCKKEGRLRNFLPSLNGLKRSDILLYSIIKEDWFNAAKSMLKNRLIVINRI